MANKFTDAVFATRQVGGTDKLVLWCIAHHANKAGEMYSGTETLAADAGVSDRTVQRAIKLCEERGILTKVGTKDHGRGHYTNVWQINLEALKFQGEDDKPGDNVTPRQSDGVTYSRDRGDTQSRPGCQGVPQTLHRENTSKDEHDKDGIDEMEEMEVRMPPASSHAVLLDEETERFLKSPSGDLLGDLTHEQRNNLYLYIDPDNECLCDPVRFLCYIKVPAPKAQFPAMLKFLNLCADYDPVDVYMTQPLIIKKETLRWGADFAQAVKTLESESPKAYMVKYRLACSKGKNWLKTEDCQAFVAEVARDRERARAYAAAKTPSPDPADPLPNVKGFEPVCGCQVGQACEGICKAKGFTVDEIAQETL